MGARKKNTEWKARIAREKNIIEKLKLACANKWKFGLARRTQSYMLHRARQKPEHMPRSLGIVIILASSNDTLGLS